MTKRDLIFFSSDDWGWKTSKYHLSREFAKDRRVVFVNSIGLRAPTLTKTDTGRIVRKIKGYLKGHETVFDNIFVLSPLIIPFRKLPFQRKLNSVFLTAWLKVQFKRLKLKDPIFFVFSPIWMEYIMPIISPSDKVIYYCVDQLSAFRGVPKGRLLELEIKLLKKASLVFSTSWVLHEKNRMVNSNSIYMPHGVNHDHFAETIESSPKSIPFDIEWISKPRIGFWGHISYDWLDINLIKSMASSNPEWSFVLIGRYSLTAEEFSGFHNINVIGEKPYDELPQYAAGLDVAIIPFNRNELTYHCNPLKLFEYFSAGLPVVSTDLPEVRRFKDNLIIASEPESFSRGIEAYIKNPPNPVDLSRIAKDQTWYAKVKKISKMIELL